MHLASRSRTCLVEVISGGDLWHSLIDIMSVYCILLFLGGTVVAVMLTWAVTMVSTCRLIKQGCLVYSREPVLNQGHLLYGYVAAMFNEQVHPVSWQIPHCVLVLKLVG